MKLLILLTVVACFQVSGRGFGQRITLDLKDVSLEVVFKEIRKQTGYSFVYTREQVERAKLVTIRVEANQLKQVLDLCFDGQPLSYLIEGNYIVVVNKQELRKASQNVSISVRGKVVDEENDPIINATVSVKGSRIATATNSLGEFVLKDVNLNDILIVSCIGYQTEEFAIENTKDIHIVLSIAIGTLDETMVIAYGKTTKRFATGSISKVSSKEIMKQPVSNSLAALQGRVPGLIVTSTSGIPGSAFLVQIRGQNSVNSTPPTPSQPIRLDQPLFIIDGVPLATQNGSITQFSSSLSPVGTEIYNNPYGGVSPFNIINPNEIESIEVLRDADATAIYGSRGANGVILITTKRGRVGKTKLTVNAYTGISRVTRTMKMMNTDQYRAMRFEAFRNDGITPTNTLVATNPSFAPDLLIFDSTKYTDWRKYFLGGTAFTSDINVAITGGTKYTQFRVGVSYHKESYIFPGDFGSNRLSTNLHMNHFSEDKRFSMEVSATYAFENNNSSASANMLQAFSLPPNYPDFLDSTGNLVWNYEGIKLNDNPIAYLRQKYSVEHNSLLGNFLISYKLLPHLNIRSSFGYNSFYGSEKAQFPKASQNPVNNPVARANFGTNNFQSWVMEPQLEYSRRLSKGNLTILLGGTYQQSTNESSQINASNYTNDALLGSPSSAGTIDVSDNYSQYKYIGAFGRINYLWNSKYVINLNGRRDGSSRFGPGKQFGNFGSIGLGWLFDQEGFIKKALPFLSYGKLRTSYGTTGDDKVGDYQFMQRWMLTSNYLGFSFQGNDGYIPLNLFNPDFSWSVTKKFEAGIELGFFKNKLLTNVTWFLSRCGNQLVSYRLPSQVGGFDGVTANFPAVVQNNGFEIELASTIIASKNFQWNASINLTIPKNKLVSFKDIESSSYATTYLVGKSLTVLRKNVFLGVNDTTGLYTFLDLDRNGTVNASDYQVVGDLDPDYYGGINTSMRWKSLEFSLHLEFRKQIGPNYLAQIYSSYPAGSYGNLPITFLDRWRAPGDFSNIARLTARRYATPAGKGTLLFARSDAAYTDASYLRVKNIYLSYSVDKKWLKAIRATTCRIYLSCQNLFTLTKYEGHDPETKSFYALPPLKTIAFGLQLTF